MKALLLGLISAGTLAAMAQSPISSVNAAGYVKVSLEPNKFASIQVPFNKFDGTAHTLADIFGSSLPNLSQVYIWSSANQRYDIFTYRTSSNTWLPSVPTVERGQGLFVRVNGGTANVDVFLYGEVPGATSNASTSFNLAPGFTSIGFPYPTATTVGNSGLLAATANLDQVYVWNASTQNYVITTRRTSPDRWTDPNVALNPGQSFFVKKGGTAGTYVANVPYSWPNN